MSIAVKNITKLFGKQRALDEVSFEIGDGEVVGFLGPNGAGKSTMMKIITGFIPPTSGQVFVNDTDIDEDPLAIRKQIGYLPESNPLYYNMYVREYLHFVAGMYKMGKDSSERVDQMIEKTGLTLEIRKKIGELSKGYKQRVGLAQAMIHDPCVLILDEPTSGLDPNQIIEIRNLITEIGKEKTILLSTHIMQEVNAICDRILIINKGKIVASESTEQLKKKSSYKKQTIQVEFGQPVTLRMLENIPNVSNAVLLADNNYIIESDTDTDIREGIFQFAVTNSLTVLSLQKRERTLEDIFQDLTR